MDRDEIIEYLKAFSIEKPYVNAMWLEGADGVNMVDEYSDIDFWFDVKNSYQESFLNECITKLNELSAIDSRVDDIRADIAQSNIHLENTSPYLTLDICVQSHETRGRDMTCYAENDIAEQPLILFDKNYIISFFQYETNIDEIRRVFENNKNKILQMSRVVKYIKRNQYLEAYMKYMENIVKPLIENARLIYTPRHYEYGLCHISHHVPAEILGELEQFYQVTCLGDIEKNLEAAGRLLIKYENELKEKYHF